MERAEGTPRPGFLTPDAARELLPGIVDTWRQECVSKGRLADRVTFAAAARAWFDERGAVAGWKPTTARNYRAMLSSERDEPQLCGQAPRARLMRAFGAMDVARVDESDVRAFLRDLDADAALPARSVNAHRLVLSMVLAYAVDQGWRDSNPVDRIPKRREGDPAELIVYTAEQVQAIARAAVDDTMASLILTAALTGLRLGELLELRWRDVRFAESVIHVQRNYAAGLGTSSTKGRRGRAVPLADQVGQVLARLGQRNRFTGRNDLVFVVPLADTSIQPRFARGTSRRAIALRSATPTCRF